MADVRIEWDDKKLLAEISGRVASGMDRACAFAADLAQARAPVRTGKLFASIAYEVSARGNVVEGRVGTLRKQAFYAYFVEMGTKSTPAQPFLRPAVFENGEEIVRLISEG